MMNHMRKNFTTCLLLAAAATVAVAAGVAQSAAPRRVAVHTAGSDVPAYWNVTGSLSLEHSETAPHAAGGKQILTVLDGTDRAEIDASRVGRVSVEDGAAPVTPVTDKTDWRVLYGAQNTCGCSSWHTMHDGSTSPVSRVATSIYPGYPGSPGLGNYFWVIDLGREYSIASVGADFAGDGGASFTWNCVPRKLKVYRSATAPAGIDAATAEVLRASAPEPFDERHMAASRAMLEADAAVDWQPLGTDSYRSLNRSADYPVGYAPLTASVRDLPVAARFIKVEIEPFAPEQGACDYQWGQGDRAFIYEIDVHRADRPGGNLDDEENVYGPDNMTADGDMDLSGTWSFALDRDGSLTADSGLDGSITLPGTTDTGRVGDALAPGSDETSHLSRRFSWCGRAWYRCVVDIPADWASSPVYLTLERTKPSKVYVDGRYAGSSNDISTPQEYDLSRFLSPGRHSVAVLVDNSSGVPGQIYGSTHAFSEDTQTNWNGIIGQIKLSTRPFARPEAASAVHPAFKDIHASGRHLYADGHRVFLRGRHDACVWPLTGHVPMDIDSWRRYFRVCADYGLNHVRFHSWCPPEAAFAAADEAGVYLQSELPFWGDFNEGDSRLMEFLHKEGENILRRYGHHPSFRMFALGNELWGSVSRMKQFVDDFRRIAPDKLYTFGSNYNLGKSGVSDGMDFFVTCRTSEETWGDYSTHTRGSFSHADAADGGMVNHFHPGASRNFQQGCLGSSVPVISHETGQFQSYPDYGSMSKYTGVLAPRNMEIFRDRLEAAGMADLAGDFHRASGLWAVRLYKQEIEMALRTPDMAGFQLLDLQDYPGQGSAYVGILDAFLDSKGFCTPADWRGWCSPVVPLVEVDRYCFTTADRIDARVKIANYGGSSLAGKTVAWSFAGKSGSLGVPDGEGLVDAGQLAISLAGVEAPARHTLTLTVGGTEATNSWDIWVYPADVDIDGLKSRVTVARELTADVARALEGGASVLLMPGESKNTVGPLFQTDYWNYRMFKTICENLGKEPSPGTLGILADPAHPLFAAFPTSGHTDWQWFPVIAASSPFKLDNTAPAYRPVVQVVDNVERNHKLGLVFEFAVGRGKLLVVMSDLEKAAEYPEGRQFYHSVLSYMLSPAFAPATSITVDDFNRLLTTDVVEGQIGALDNISPYK